MNDDGLGRIEEPILDMDAIALNQVLDGTIVSCLLSSYGKRSYFPRGIVAQSVEAKTKAHQADGTAGVALKNRHHMSLSWLQEAVPALSIDEQVSYAPVAGDPKLREAWLQRMVTSNPTLEGKTCSLPVVVSGLTHALSVAADLFIDPGMPVVVPTPAWDNYRQLFAVRHASRMIDVPLFTSGEELNVLGLWKAIMEDPSERLVLLVNFPHNPTGYTPLEPQWLELVSMVQSCADSGKKLLVLVDDAYFGLFHTPQASRQSLFAALCDLHENVLAVKCDAATKEALVWGFRVGFITFGAKGLTNNQYNAMVQKTMGAVRTSVSSSSRIGQSLLMRALADGSFIRDTRAVAAEMAERYSTAMHALELHRDHWNLLSPLPCNSGYFFCLKCAGSSEHLRTVLLEQHGVGTVSLGRNLLRIAYSGIDREDIAKVVDLTYRVAEVLWT